MGIIVQRRRKSEWGLDNQQGSVSSVQKKSRPQRANNDDYEVSEPPKLRRAGSSTLEFSLLSSFGNNESEAIFSPNVLAATRPQIDHRGSGRYSNPFATLDCLVVGMTADFCKNGLPWKGSECRSIMAELSGMLYALPALAAAGHDAAHLDQILWTAQAIISVIADYYYICQDSFWHGIDRYFAIFNAITIISRVYVVLSWKIALVAIIPFGCFVAANRAKKQRNLEAWHVWHCLWHVSGGPLLGLVMYMIYNNY